MNVHDLPAINASLNALAAVLLATGFVAIKSGNKDLHRRCMGGAFGVSTIFLISYVTHKFLVRGVHTLFNGEGAWRTIYYGMLISHIVLAMVILPLVVVTLRYALLGRFEQHKAWARWTLPIWSYVSVTGVLVYFFLYQWFPAH